MLETAGSARNGYLLTRNDKLLYELLDLPRYEDDAAQDNKDCYKPSEPCYGDDVTVSHGGEGNDCEIDRIGKGLYPGTRLIVLCVEYHPGGDEDDGKDDKNDADYNDMSPRKASVEEMPSLQEPDEPQNPQGPEDAQYLIALRDEEEGDYCDEVHYGVYFKYLSDAVRC